MDVILLVSCWMLWVRFMYLVASLLERGIKQYFLDVFKDLSNQYFLLRFLSMSESLMCS